jgi:CheY-like chemotaxis protein
VFKEDLKRFKQAGANAVLPKPFDKDSLLENIYKYIK